MPKTHNTPPKNFEESMKRLDEIVGRLEEDKLPLDDMIALYEEGVTLARACGEKLEAAEQKVRLIAKQNDGRIALQNFDEHGEN